ncbi:MAG: iron-containing alcohol dehydrogenase [Clostridia bacterium]|nr:iron-containing alcohol dehydrogenase [Clostridia bacterium]
MNIFSKFYCRVYQTIFRIFLPMLPYREPKILSDNSDLLKVLEDNNYDNIMLVTDKGIRDIGLTKTLEDFLHDNGISVHVYDDTVANPTTQNVEEAVNLYKEKECQALIAIGGGSPMDCAKGVGARLACPNKTLNDMKGLFKVNHKLPLLIAIPTTAGTGSETTLATVITDNVTRHKYAINDFDLIPNYALLDAKLTLSLPKQMTATSGMDALTHAIEAYIGRSTTNSTRRNALTAIKLIFENLEVAYNDGNNLQARKRMLRASYKAGLAFTKSYVGYIHAVAHSLGGKYNVAHGFANAVILPYVLKKYGKSAYKKLWKIGRFCGLFDEKTSYENGAKLVIEKIESMNKNMGISSKIAEIKKEDVSILAKTAAKEANPLYPIPKLFTAKDLESIYYEIME